MLSNRGSGLDAGWSNTYCLFNFSNLVEKNSIKGKNISKCRENGIDRLPIRQLQRGTENVQLW